MYEILINADNLVEAYHKALVALNEHGIVMDCPDWNCKQKEVSMTIHIEHPLSEPMISRLAPITPEALNQYVMEICDGLLDCKIDDERNPYTYHDRMVNYNGKNQLKFIIDELNRNKETRRAVIDIRNNMLDMYAEDIPCLNHLQFFIRNNKLDCCVLFRSNDSTRATFYNMFGLINLQQRLSEQLNIEVGTFTLRANSFHCYESCFEDLKNYSKAIETKPIEKLSFNYKGNWETKMKLTDEIVKNKFK